jgi:RNA polymerase sigma factor (sigma-70 family)
VSDDKDKQIEHFIEGCVQGKREAQAELYQYYSSKMFAVCLYYSKDQTEAEDILHDAFMKVFKNIGQYSGKGSFEGWIKRIMINTALERFRRQSYMYSVEDVFDYVEEISPEDVVSSISFNDLLALIRELSPQYRMVFNLYAVEGHSHKEIADMLNISVGTSKSNLARARKILQEKVKEKFLLPAGQKKMVI